MLLEKAAGPLAYRPFPLQTLRLTVWVDRAARFGAEKTDLMQHVEPSRPRGQVGRGEGEEEDGDENEMERLSGHDFPPGSSTVGRARLDMSQPPGQTRRHAIVSGIR
jgi:hypothetical protein